MQLTPGQELAKRYIQDAYTLSRETGNPHYVGYTSDGSSWMVKASQPPVTQSHWMVLPDGATFAHISEPDLVMYRYEELK